MCNWAMAVATGMRNVNDPGRIRTSELFGKTIDADDVPQATPTPNIEKLWPEKTDDLEVLLKRIRTKTLKLTYLPAGRREGRLGRGRKTNR